MPRKTLWIRDEDLEAFEKIKDRAEWLHQCIVLGPETHSMMPRVGQMADTLRNPLNAPKQAPESPQAPLNVNSKSHNYSPPEETA